MMVIIAEKSSVAKDIARVLNVHGTAVGYLFNENYYITWAFGQLIELASPAAYGFTTWNKTNLPILPEKFLLNVKQIKGEDGKLKDDPGIEKQLKIIKELFEKSDSIIYATDAGREGELIFRYIVQFLGSNKPYERLWISSLTDVAIKAGFEHLRAGNKYDTLFYSARARSEADWLVGINGTQSLSLAINKGLFSLGRVQTPTLALICKRFQLHQGFKSKTSFTLKICCKKNASHFIADYFDNGIIHHFETKDAGIIFLNSLIDEAKVANLESEIKIEPPPLLYDLTALQIDAIKRYSISANDTLEATQKLYENKFISYPRTGSRYISEDVLATIPGLIKKLSKIEHFYNSATDLLNTKLNTRSVDGSKVTDHHALLTTENNPSGLMGDQLNIYNLIAARLLESFSQICEKKISTITLSVKDKVVNENSFVAKNTQIIKSGWRSILNINEDDSKEEYQNIPSLELNEILPVIEKNLIEQKSKPKPLHTEASLLKEMENCGKAIEDENLRAAMKQVGLGTPATRANIIETLFKRQFIERNKKSLIPTERGLLEYNLVKDKKIAQPLLTGEWEKKLDDIRLGTFDVEIFNKEIRQYTSELTEEMLAINGVHLLGNGSIICPKCKKGEIIFNPTAAECSQYKNGCTFAIFGKVASKRLTDTDIKQLLNKRKSKLIKGFISKTGKEFDAILLLSDDLNISFDFSNSIKK